jgi:hypothetical protein
MDDSERQQRFAAAFPWWKDGSERLGWSVKVDIQPGVKEVRRGGILLGLQHDPEKDHGKIRIHMPGATAEQYDAVLAWMTAEFGPTAKLPTVGR